MSKEILDKIRKRKNNPTSDSEYEKDGERRALIWVLRLFNEHEKSLKRKVLFEKTKKRKPRKPKVEYETMDDRIQRIVLTRDQMAQWIQFIR